MEGSRRGSLIEGKLDFSSPNARARRNSTFNFTEASMGGQDTQLPPETPTTLGQQASLESEPSVAGSPSVVPHSLGSTAVGSPGQQPHYIGPPLHFSALCSYPNELPLPSYSRIILVKARSKRLRLQGREYGKPSDSERTSKVAVNSGELTSRLRSSRSFIDSARAAEGLRGLKRIPTMTAGTEGNTIALYVGHATINSSNTSSLVCTGKRRKVRKRNQLKLREKTPLLAI